MRIKYLQLTWAAYFLFALCESEELDSNGYFCKVNSSDKVILFGNRESNGILIKKCYTIIAVDSDSCTTEVWSCPRFAIMLRRIDDIHMILKIIMPSEVIEVKNNFESSEKEGIILLINGEELQYNATSTQADKYSIKFKFFKNGSEVELRNSGFHLRFNGSILELRILNDSNIDKICGICHKGQNNFDHVRHNLASGGFLKDEHENCRIRAENPPAEKCEVSTNRISSFNERENENTTLNKCYTIIAADFNTCTINQSISLRSRYLVLMRNLTNKYSKVKIVTNQEVIELEKNLNGSTENERKLLRVIIDGQLIGYRVDSMANSAVENLCTVEFMREDFSIVELQNQDFWLRFDGENVEFRLLKREDLINIKACGSCQPSHTDPQLITTIQKSLANHGFLSDEPQSCDISTSATKVIDQTTVALVKTTTQMPEDINEDIINDFINTDGTHIPHPLDYGNDASNTQNDANDENENKLKNKRIIRIIPSNMTIIDAHAHRVCASTKAVIHCAPDSVAHFAKDGNDRSERVPFVCLERTKRDAQELLNLSFRRRYLQTAANGGRLEEARWRDVDVERALALNTARQTLQDVEYAMHDKVLWHLNKAGFTLVHRIPRYCTISLQD